MKQSTQTRNGQHYFLQHHKPSHVIIIIIIPSEFEISENDCYTFLYGDYNYASFYRDFNFTDDNFYS